MPQHMDTTNQVLNKKYSYIIIIYTKMSYNTISISFAIVVMLYATANPVADATIIRNQLRVTGRLCCTVDGNCATNSTGVSGAVVNLSCPPNIFSPPTLVGQGITDGTGNFIITVFIGLFPNINQCRVTVTLPLTGAAAVSCPLLANTTAATLISPVQLVSITTVNLFQKIFNAIAPRFTRI